jgi:ComF family protein
VGKAEAVRLAIGAANALLTAAFAPECAACRAPLEMPVDGCVCARCWAAIEPPPHVEFPTTFIAAAVAAGDYAGTLREIIHAFKYDDRRSLARPLAELMRASGASLLDDADCVVPVPLHPWRRMRRGFNQAAALAACLGPPMAHALWRWRATAAQAGLTAAERRRNVRRAFRLSPLLTPKRRNALLRGRVIVLVDDVRTTGATLHACAEVLMRAEAREVRVLTAAVRGVRNSGATRRGLSLSEQRLDGQPDVD